jgi:hypothetical protein
MGWFARSFGCETPMQGAEQRGVQTVRRTVYIHSSNGSAQRIYPELARPFGEPCQCAGGCEPPLQGAEQGGGGGAREERGGGSALGAARVAHHQRAAQPRPAVVVVVVVVEVVIVL